jgi:hypothetical protein
MKCSRVLMTPPRAQYQTLHQALLQMPAAELQHRQHAADLCAQHRAKAEKVWRIDPR